MKPQDSVARPSWTPVSVCPNWAFWVAILGGGVARLYQCWQPLARTADLYRHIFTGIMVGEQGWRAAAMPLAAWSARAGAISPWSELPYNYPPLTLAFFRCFALTYPSVLTAKLFLTACEGLNTCLVLRLTGQRALAALYWCLPLSIWWVSREGQIEPLQNSLVLIALIGLRSARPWSWGAWLAACQVKVLPVLAAPQFIRHLFLLTPRRRHLALAWSLAALTPLAVSMCLWPVVSQVLSSFHQPMTFNFWHWRAPFDARFRGWAPPALELWVHCFQAILAGFILLLLWRRRFAWDAALTCLLFLGASATMGIFQGWYFCALIPFVLCAKGAADRLWLVVLVQLCEPLSLWQIFIRPVGWGGPTHLIPISQLLTAP